MYNGRFVCLYFVIAIFHYILIIIQQKGRKFECNLYKICIIKKAGKQSEGIIIVLNILVLSAEFRMHYIYNVNLLWLIVKIYVCVDLFVTCKTRKRGMAEIDI